MHTCAKNQFAQENEALAGMCIFLTVVKNCITIKHECGDFLSRIDGVASHSGTTLASVAVHVAVLQCV